jgi:hypothetical protein
MALLLVKMFGYSRTSEIFRAAAAANNNLAGIKKGAPSNALILLSIF